MKGKWLSFVVVLCCVFTLVLLSFTCYKFSCVEEKESNYSEGNTRERELEKKKKELEQIKAQEEEKLINLNEQWELYVEEDISNDSEDELRQHYITKKETEDLARCLILKELQGASYVTLSGERAENLETKMKDTIIDELFGNGVISAGVKAAIAESGENLEVEDIIDNAVEGAMAEIPEYIRGEMVGAVSEIVGIDIFGIADWLSNYVNADDTPVKLANSIMEEQQEDISLLLVFLEREELTGADMKYMAGIVRRIAAREEELKAIGCRIQNQWRCAGELEKLAEIWEKNNYLILQYAKAERDSNEN